MIVDDPSTIKPTLNILKKTFLTQKTKNLKWRKD